MVTERPLYIGVDVGASRTKVAVLSAESNLIGRSVAKSGIDFAATAERCLDEALEMAGADASDIVSVTSTGYGRNNVTFARNTLTEIACHGKGCYHYFPMAQSIIDIGGQDNKIIKLDANGRRVSFKMNRKCAAGTGAFLEEMAMRLDTPLGQMDQLAAEAQGMIKLGSYCTVFSATEVLTHIRNGEKLPDIVKGLFYSMIKRVVEMEALTDTVVMTGGVVAHNPYMAAFAQEILGLPIRTPEFPQFTGAVGAALFAMQNAQSAS
ncbi:MAG: acyl-CoA dehydratase activase [Desulfobacteraceae bacterium]|jgi:predicted CoA-substrate-specific enzyme activase